MSFFTVNNMNSAKRICVVIAWLMVTITVKPSDADEVDSLAPLLASAINQLSVGNVTEITPHVEALANIVKGNNLYSLFHHIEEECHKYQNKLKNKEQSSTSKETNEGNIEKSQAEKETSVEENDASKKVDEQPEREALNKEVSDSESSSSDSEATSGGQKVPNARKRYTLKDLPENGRIRRWRKNVEVGLLRVGNKLTVKLRKPGETDWTQSEFDISGKARDQLLINFIDKLISA